MNDLLKRAAKLFGLKPQPEVKVTEITPDQTLPENYVPKKEIK